MGVEEEKESILKLVDQVFDVDTPVADRAISVTQIQVKLHNYLIDNVVTLQKGEIYPPNPKKVVTDL